MEEYKDIPWSDYRTYFYRHQNAKKIIMEKSLLKGIQKLEEDYTNDDLKFKIKDTISVISEHQFLEEIIVKAIADFKGKAWDCELPYIDPVQQIEDSLHKQRVIHGDMLEILNSINQSLDPHEKLQELEALWDELCLENMKEKKKFGFLMKQVERDND